MPQIRQVDPRLHRVAFSKKGDGFVQTYVPRGGGWEVGKKPFIAALENPCSCFSKYIPLVHTAWLPWFPTHFIRGIYYWHNVFFLFFQGRKSKWKCTAPLEPWIAWRESGAVLRKAAGRDGEIGICAAHGAGRGLLQGALVSQKSKG